MSRSSKWTAPAAGMRWTAADGSAALRAWKGSGLSMAEFERRHELGVGRLRWWKRQNDGVELDAVAWAPVVATESSSGAAVIVRAGDVEIEARADLVPTQWLADLVTALTTSRTRSVEIERGSVIPQLLAERVRETRETTRAHPDRQVLTRDVARGDQVSSGFPVMIWMTRIDAANGRRAASFRRAPSGSP